MSANRLKIVIAQLNLSVGHIRANTAQIIQSIQIARDTHRADLIVFPELSICSYPPEDLLLRPAFHHAIETALTQITNATGDIYALVGHPHQHQGLLYNACSLIHKQTILQRYDKQNLPNYGVFDEKRYFTAGHETALFEINNITAAISICEDLWIPEPANTAADLGAKILFNINASPYHQTKLAMREKMIAERAQNARLHIVYTNLVGGQDELLFDGNSMVVDSHGRCLAHAPAFTEGLFPVEVAIDIGAAMQVKQATPKITDADLTEEARIYPALVLGVQDYIKKNYFKGAIIGLSGGIDSALTLAIAVDALGADNVEALIMPSRYSADISTEDACLQAKMLAVDYDIIAIEQPFTAFLKVLETRFKDLPVDTTEENIQARCRGILLMAVSNKTGKIVLTTGNKSEMAVGYATLYGDMAGGFAPLKDVWKTMVYRLAAWRNKQKIVIPKRVMMRPPTAELRPDQLDQDSLPDYETLDCILARYIEQDQTPAQIIAAGFDSDRVYQVVKLVDHNEYKRRQAAPGTRITARAFGRDRRYPISSGYVEQ